MRGDSRWFYVPPVQRKNGSHAEDGTESKSKRKRGCSRTRCRRVCCRAEGPGSTSDGYSSSSGGKQRRQGNTSDSESSDGGCLQSGSSIAILPANAKGWSVRRRDPRVNGADIYVARFLKNGMGNARPCWRCLEWCRWAGIKRVFHWDGETGRWECVKVNDANKEPYETRADGRLAAGLVRLPNCSVCCNVFMISHDSLSCKFQKILSNFVQPQRDIYMP